MIRKLVISALTAACVLAFAGTAHADEYTIEGLTADSVSSYELVSEESGVMVMSSPYDCGAGLFLLEEGETAEVTAQLDGWVRIRTEAGEGYVQLKDDVYCYEVVETTVDPEMGLRQDIVNYALQFVGNRYVWGGTDPNFGADCSGFTQYVMEHVAGVALSHSARAQSGEGETIDRSQLKPGDLVFYSSKGRIDHVAIYMGEGQIVHASSSKNGIRVSNLDNSRSPVKFVSVLG